MPYQTGSATDPVDLLQQLETWLAAHGWTMDRNATEGSGWTTSMHRGSNYVHLRATLNEATPWQSGFSATHYALHMYMGTAFNSGNPWNAQTGGPLGASSNPIGVGMHLSAGPFSNYYFFSDSAGDNIVVVVEKTPGLFVHLCWGVSLEKAGSWTGGPYFTGSSSGYYTSYTSAGPNVPGFTSSTDCPFPQSDQIGGGAGFVRADVDSFTSKWVGIWQSAGGADQGYTGKEGLPSVGTQNFGAPGAGLSFPMYKANSSAQHYDLQASLTSVIDGRANLLPQLLWAQRDGTSSGFSLLGKMPNVFATNAVGSGFTAAEEYTIGPTTYKLFPNFAVVKQ